MQQTERETIVFFDGHCGLCNHFVDFLLSRDRNQRLRFTPLQGETAQVYLGEKLRSNLDTVVVITRDAQGNVTNELHKSDAALMAFSALSSEWAGFVRLLHVFPKSFRNLVYDFVARNRFKIFGRSDLCRIPSPDERKMFLT